ncbi:hypothetical protein C8Q77DRAFT_1055140 [Trametes polyzona]|nr:hypothetical protein C8Q77DRAFT_1055140 [Trametes polyzona]
MQKSMINVLNWDVLLHITTFLARPDLSRLSQTCRALHALTLRQLFHDPIELNAKNLLSFYACLSRDGTGRRAAFVKELTINCSLSRLRRTDANSDAHEEYVPAAQVLAAILRSTHRLKRLELDWAAAGLSSYLPEAVSALANLDQIRIPFASQKLWDDLQNLRAPLRKISVQFGPVGGTGITDPVPLLERFSSTLQEADLSCVQFKESAVSYPRVSKLSVSNSYCDFFLGGIDAAPVALAFPGLQELSLSAAGAHPEVSQWVNGRSCDKPELIERCRRTNKHDLAELNGFQRLRKVVAGHVADLYMLGLNQHVPNVEIGMLSQSTLHMLEDVLQDTHPTSLTLSLFAVDHVLDCIPRLFKPSSATDGLAHMTLTLRCAKPDINTDKLLTNLSALLAPLRLGRLTLHFQRWDTVGVYYLPEKDLRPIDACLDRIYEHAGDIAGTIIKDVPSLRAVDVRVGDRLVERQATLSS